MKKLLILFAILVFTVTTYAQINGANQMLFQGAASSFGNSIPSAPSFKPKAETIGNQYLFEDWVSGELIDDEGNIYSDGYLFNFNKINQNIYYKKKDSAGNFIVNKSLVKSIKLSDGIKTYTLEKVPAIDNDNLYCVLVKGGKYSLYSLTKTNFVAANFFTNGFTSSGSMYDEFKDEVKYYVITADSNAKEVPLNRKAIKKVFEPEKDKVNAFFRKNNTAGVFEEETLKSLVQSISL